VNVPRAARRYRPAVVWRAALLGVLALGACSTSGRELRETSMTIPPAASSGGNGSADTSATSQERSLIEGLGGFAMTSPEFVADGSLPREVGRDGGNRSPALQWTATPESAAELALVASDASGREVYWLVTALAATDVIVAPGETPLGGTVQVNSAGRAAWDGPQGGAGTSVPVVFRLYALEVPVGVAPGADPGAVVQQIAASSFASATLTANYLGADQPQAN
jgi:phosphatidylethanolamine-binding protein (PEBP) family uncharacterized protein